MARTRRIVVGVGVALALLVIAGALAIAMAGNKTRPRTPASPAPRSSSLPAGRWHPVPPATTIPQQTPVQMEYDHGFEHGFSSPKNQRVVALAEALRLPAPAISGGWPTLPTSNTPGTWTREFVHGLLDVNFAHQSRSGLGAWLVAQEAPDLMPGVPPGFQNRALYVSVMEPQITGQAPPVPSATQWKADAVAGVRWSVRGLQVQLDPQWQSMISAGWQPRDLRAAVEDVSGVLTITHGTATTTLRFSMVLQVGSAHWRRGYGAVLVSNWKES